MSTLTKVLLVILVVLLVLLVVLYFYGRKLQEKQAEQQQMIDAQRQTVSLLVIDKKKLKIKNSGLPQMVIDQVPWYSRMMKFPIVKAKIGPKVMTLIADGNVFEQLPVNRECKVVVSGLYILEIKSARGGLVPVQKKLTLKERILGKKSN